jgi:hypothetical protein
VGEIHDPSGAKGRDAPAHRGGISTARSRALNKQACSQGALLDSGRSPVEKPIPPAWGGSHTVGSLGQTWEPDNRTMKRDSTRCVTS